MSEEWEPLATFVHLGHIEPRRDWRTEVHAHTDYHQLIVVLDGTIESQVNGASITGQRGDLLHYARGLLHAEKAVGERLLRLCFIHWESEESASMAQWPYRFTDSSGRSQVLIQWIREMFPPTKPSESRMINLLLNTTLCALAQAGHAREQEMIKRIKAYIRDHLCEPLSLDTLAAEIGLSKFHFSREFKRAAGVTPMQLLRRMRVETAHSLLVTTTLPLKAIAPYVGFADEFQLSRVFRRVTGISPRDVRQRHAGSAMTAPSPIASIEGLTRLSE